MLCIFKVTFSLWTCTSVVKVKNLNIKGIFMIECQSPFWRWKVKFETDSFPCLNILPIFVLNENAFLVLPTSIYTFLEAITLFSIDFPISPTWLPREKLFNSFVNWGMDASLPQPSASEVSTSVSHDSEVTTNGWWNESAQVGREILGKSFASWLSLALLSCLTNSLNPHFFPLEFFSWFFRTWKQKIASSESFKMLRLPKTNTQVGILSISILNRGQWNKFNNLIINK